MKGDDLFVVLTHEQDFQRLYEHLKARARAAAQRGEPLSVEVLAHEKKRTPAQVRFYWVILNQISEKAWIMNGKIQKPAKWWDLYMKQEILGDSEMHTPTGAIPYAEYVQKVQVIAGELGVSLELQDGL